MLRSTPTAKFALLLGAAYSLVGLLGFVPQLVQPPPISAPDLSVGTLYGYLLGIFPVNVLHDLVHFAVGAIGIATSRRLSWAIAYCRAMSVIFAGLTVMGLLPDLGTMLGLIPVFGADVALHGLTAVASAYFGWVAPELLTGDAAPRPPAGLPLTSND
jgi:hypothetical protein